jgi:hypothetical protein
VGFNIEKTCVLDITHGNFSLKFKLRNKDDNFKWNLIAVYGAAQQVEKENFLSELVQMGSTENLPLMLGGDFNIIRSPNEKITTNIMINGHFYLMLS